MTAWKGRCRLLTRFVSTGHALIKETIIPTRYGECLVVGGEVIAHIGKGTVGNVIKTCGQIIVLRPSDGQEDEDDVKDKERRQDDEFRTVELLIAAEEVEQRDEGNHREIRCIAQVHKFAEHRMRPRLCERQSRMTAEKLLFIGRKYVVEVKFNKKNE